MYQQVAPPNLAIVGTVGLCEKYTEDVFGVTTPRHDADALAGWNQDKGQHPGETPPANISVPLAFNWFGTIDGVYKNWGHRCVWANGKVYSSPLSGTGHLVYDSILAIQKAFGLGAYLGWSEYIEDKQVVKENDMQLSESARYIAIRGILGREPTQAEMQNQDYANNAELLLQTLWNNGGETRYEQTKNPPAPADAVLLKPGTYKVN